MKAVATKSLFSQNTLSKEVPNLLALSMTSKTISQQYELLCQPA